MFDTLQTLISLLEQVTRTLHQLEEEIAQAAIVAEIPAKTSLSPENVDSEDDLNFDEARRRILWDGGDCPFNYRKRDRYTFIQLLWEHLGEYVTAEDIIRVFPTKEKQKWSSLRRFGKRIQEDDLGPKNCPFYIRIESEGFTLIQIA